MDTSTQRPGPPILRFAHALAFTTYLEELGTPTERYLHRQGLALYDDDPNLFVSLHRAWSFFDAAARREDDMLGWHVGRYVGDQKLNHKFLRELEGAPTLYSALNRLVRMSSAEASHVRLGILERRHDILLFTEYPSMKGEPGYHLSQSYQLGLFLDLIRHFLGKSWLPDEIGIEYPSVPKEAKEHFPGSRIMTRQRAGYISVPRSCLHVAASGDASGRGKNDSLLMTRELDYAATLGLLLEAYLPGGYPSTRLAASLMGTSVRTLTRRLSECGVTYRHVVDQARFRAASELLKDPDLRITDVSIAVGFVDSSNFARMFRRIGGLSPRQFRRASSRQ